jgi:hypothetical protein
VKLKPKLSTLPGLATNWKICTCKGIRHQFNLSKPTFSIKAHFLIWDYQACNNNNKLVISMATNLVLENIMLPIRFLTVIFISALLGKCRALGKGG